MKPSQEFNKSASDDDLKVGLSEVMNGLANQIANLLPDGSDFCVIVWPLGAHEHEEVSASAWSFDKPEAAQLIRQHIEIMERGAKH